MKEWKSGGAIWKVIPALLNKTTNTILTFHQIVNHKYIAICELCFRFNLFRIMSGAQTVPSLRSKEDFQPKKFLPCVGCVTLLCRIIILSFKSSETSFALRSHQVDCDNVCFYCLTLVMAHLWRVCTLRCIKVQKFFQFLIVVHT